MILAAGTSIQIEPGLLTVGLLATLFLLSFFFSGTETALFSLQKLDRHSLAGEGGASAQVAGLLDRGRRPLLSTILIGNETVNIGLSTIAASLVAILVPEYAWLNVIILTPTLVLISEITPKVIAFRHRRRWARWAIWPLTLLHVVLWPVRTLFTMFVGVLARAFGARAELDQDGLEEEELMVLVDRGAAAGTVDPMERDIIEAVFEFDELTVERLMTPRPDMLTLPVTLSPAELLQRCSETGMSRIPMYDGDPDNVVGILLVKDMLRHQLAPPLGPRQMRSMLLPPTFVPATKPADDMLEEFLAKRLHMALVVDEHGTMMGLITLDDLLDELMGELDDPSEEQEIAREDSGRTTVRAGMDVEDFEEETGICLPEGDWHTVGGFVFHELGRLPRLGDQVQFEKVEFRVEEMDGRRITSLLLIDNRSAMEAS